MSFSFHLTETTAMSWPLRIAAVASISAVLPCAIVIPARAASFLASRVTAVTRWPRDSASSRMRRPTLPVAPTRARLDMVISPASRASALSRITLAFPDTKQPGKRAMATTVLEAQRTEITAESTAEFDVADVEYLRHGDKPLLARI